MSKTYDFLKECGVFYVLTVNGEFPAGRPFGAIMERNEDLYISTANMKDVYKQLKDHPQMQIVALKAGTREWLRLNGVAEECVDLDVKQKMLEECPNLTKHFSSPDVPHFAVFQIKVLNSELY
jgi:uncharacterized pyridoxamine 5'-phosphate oxidase family protein